MLQTILSIFGMALTIAVFYWLVNIDAGVVSAVFQMSPVVCGLCLGFLFGDMKTSLATGAMINMMYLSLNQVGGNIAMDPSLAAVLMIPVAVQFRTGPAFAAAAAIPFSLIGGALDNLRRSKNARWIRNAKKCAGKGDTAGIAVSNVLLPVLTQALIRIPAMFLLAAAVISAMHFGFAYIPGWLKEGISLAGILFSAMGVVSCIIHTETGRRLLFFGAAFFISALSGMPIWILQAGVIAAAAAGTYIRWKKTYVPVPKRAAEPYIGSVSRKLLRRTGCKLAVVFRFGNNFENFFGTGVCHALSAPLKQIWQNDPEELTDALTRHLEPFITEFTVGSAVVGAALAMEDQKAAGENVSGNEIAALKSSLMGPYAGFGDPFFNGTVAAFLRCLFVPYAVAGSAAGILGELLYRSIGWLISIKCFENGYRYGKVMLLQLMKNPVIGYLKAAMPCATMLLLGVIAGSVLTPMLAESVSFLPAFSPFLSRSFSAVLLLAVMAGGYAYLKKNGKLLTLLAITGVLAVIAVLVF